MKLSLGAALVAVTLLAASACGSSSRTSSPPTTVSSSALTLGGTVRCTATLTTPVQAGRELRVSFRFHNVSTQTAHVDLAYGGMWAFIQGTDGASYDTRIPVENQHGPTIPPVPIAPGATKTVRLPPVRVRWEGPLRVTPGCGLSALHAVRIPVTSPGRPASAKAAVKAVVAATGHLLDRCRPVFPGVAVTGRIDAPHHSAPPLRTQCSVTLRAKTGFDVAQVLVTTTPKPPHVRLNQLYEQFTWPPNGGNAIAVAWQFVVTKDGATSVAAANVESSTGKGFASAWEWTSTGPSNRRGRAGCGGTGGGGGSYLGPLVVFVSACG